MKRFLSICMILVLLLCGCASNTETGTKDESRKETAVTTEQKETETAEPSGEDTATDTASAAGAASFGRVSVSGTDFVMDGNVIYMNGVNTPWDNWNDCGGEFDESFWDIQFETLKSVGINSVRVWISCNGANIEISDDGIVSGPTEQFWDDLSTLVGLAEKHEIYLMLTLMSFDNFKDEGQNYMAWRNMLSSDEGIQSMVDNYVLQLLGRVGSSPAVWSIDLCNEPDWIVENEECGKLSWDSICKLFALESAAIHENSDVLVTVGFGMIKYNSDSYSGNYGSDSYLQSLSGMDASYLDFDSPHFYEWEATWYGFPMDTDPVSFGLTGTKPAVIGEFPATGFTDSTSGSKNMTASECYISLYENGWNGCMAWTSNGVDDCGSLKDFVEGAEEVANRISAN